jgi:hypothetical protein
MNVNSASKNSLLMMGHAIASSANAILLTSSLMAVVVAVKMLILHAWSG